MMALKKVGALWLKVKDGNKYMSGKMAFDVPAGTHKRLTGPRKRTSPY